MTDIIDQASAREEMDRALAIARATAKPTRPGLPFCDDCSEAVSPTRQAFGARLCIDCQRDSELRAATIGKRA